MDKETIEQEEDFNIDELLGEDEDSPIEEKITNVKKGKKEKKVKSAPKGTPAKEEEQDIPVEVAEANKDLANMEWQPFSQQAYEGFQNIKTGEVIDDKEALRRTLCYAQEAARSSR